MPQKDACSQDISLFLFLDSLRHLSLNILQQNLKRRDGKCFILTIVYSLLSPNPGRTPLNKDHPSLLPGKGGLWYVKLTDFIQEYFSL
jgi:hypothetical protein